MVNINTAVKMVKLVCVCETINIHSYCADISSTIDWQLSNGIGASLSENISTRYRQVAG